MLAGIKGSLAGLAGSAALDTGSARSLRGSVGDGQRDAAGGGSELGMAGGGTWLMQTS